MKKINLLIIILIYIGLSCSVKNEVMLLEDDFSGLDTGSFSVNVGAHTEYHYLPEAAPGGNWAVTSFRSGDEYGRAWQVRINAGRKYMAQTYWNGDSHFTPRMTHTHPMIVAGDSLWQDYIIEVEFTPHYNHDQAGIIFRYRNDRCYYFFGMEGNCIVLTKVNHATGFHRPLEQVLSYKHFNWEEGKKYNARVCVKGNHIQAYLDDIPFFDLEDNEYSQGKIALMSDFPTDFHFVRVTTTSKEKRRIEEKERIIKNETRIRLEANPKPVLWKKINTEGFGAGRNLRFGDLNGDKQIDVLIGQIVHHGPRDAYSELSCLTVMTFNGDILWQTGNPDPEKYHLTNDVAFQIHDIDGDGHNEVIYTMNFEIIIADGATGRVKHKSPTPESKPNAQKYPRILGDCLCFCDFRGLGRDGDVVIKDRYWNVWAYDERLNLLWEGSCITGHYPYAFDVDRDGKDELLMGYTLFDDDGTRIWSMDEWSNDHADGVAVVNFMENENAQPKIFFGASDWGAFFTDLEGNILRHHFIGHVQNPAIANFRSDLPGLEVVTINFWGNQGIIHFFDAEGNIYHDFEPMQYGSMMLPVNWTGKDEEYFVLNANVKEGGMFDGWGRLVVAFPDDGHPDMCNAVLDITGDCRDEVVVWDPHEIWVYTQDNNPKEGKLYKPLRNPLYNYSNYQLTVSEPGWD